MNPNDPIFWPLAVNHRDLRGHLCWCRSCGHEALSSCGCRRQAISRTSPGSAARALVIASNTAVASWSPSLRWEFSVRGSTASVNILNAAAAKAAMQIGPFAGVGLQGAPDQVQGLVETPHQLR